MDRLEDALRKAGEDLKLAPEWQQRVWEGIQRDRRRKAILVLVLLVCALLATVMFAFVVLAQ